MSNCKEYIIKTYEDRIAWYNKRGELHREDGPAIEFVNRYKAWLINGVLHREDGPAIEYSNGDKFWCKNGKFHREDGPAVEWSNGDKEWWANGKCYRITTMKHEDYYSDQFKLLEERLNALEVRFIEHIRTHN